MYLKKLFKTQRGRIPFNPAILAAIVHRFIAQREKSKNADERIWDDARRDQKPETFLGGGGLRYYIVDSMQLEEWNGRFK